MNATPSPLQNTRWLLWATLTICSVPTLLILLGVEFGSHSVPLNPNNYLDVPSGVLADGMFHALTGAFTHTILEWSAFCIAAFVVLLALIHYRIKGDAATPIIAIALFCAGCMDAFHTLAATRLIDACAPNANFIPFTWAVCRIFNALIMIAGVGLYLIWGNRKHGISARLIIAISVGFGLVAYAIIHYSAESDSLPQTMFPGSLITRPYDFIPLLLFTLVAFPLYLLFYRRQRTLFSLALLISLIPDVVTQMHMAFGSSALFDHHFNIAHFLKIVVYAVPLAGLCLEYVQIHRDDISTTNQLAQEMLTRQTLEQSLMESNKKFHNIIENAADGIVTIDEKGLIQSFNAIAVATFGYAPDEVIGRNVNMLMPEPDHSQHDGYIRAFLDTGVPRFMGSRREVQGKRKDGTTFPMDLSISDVHLQRGRLFTGIIRNNTEQKKAEHQLRQLASSVTAAGEAIVITDPEGTITFINPAFSRLTGYSFDEAIGQNSRIIHSEKQSAEFYNKLWNTIVGGNTWSGEVTNKKKDGSLYDAHLTIAPIFNDQEIIEGFVSIQSDLTDMRQTQILLEYINNKLTAKNQELEQFTYTASHDLKSPLVTMLGFIGHLKRDAEQGRTDRLGKFADRIEQAGHRMKQNVDDLLELSRIGRITNEILEIDIAGLVKDLVDEYRDSIESAGVTVVIQDDMPPIRGDRKKIHQVMDNLLTNALKYGCTNESPTIEIGAEVDQNTVRIFVRDNGPGIAEEFHQKIFGLFQRLEKRDDSTGVGLALVARAVEVHGGRCGVESAPGKGATFWITLPIRPIDTPENSTSIPELSPPKKVAA